MSIKQAEINCIDKGILTTPLALCVANLMAALLIFYEKLGITLPLYYSLLV